MIPFGTTQHLLLRPFKDSDRPSLFNLINDQRVAHGNTLGYPVPISDAWWEQLKAEIQRLYMVVLVIEVKKEFLFMRGFDPYDRYEDESETDVERRERMKFVGYVCLQEHEAKNKDLELGISLAFAWWSHGLGTEVLQWLLRYNFETLGMHRMTLRVFGDNERAVELYKYLGFVEEGRMREAVSHEAGWIDFVMMSMLDREWHEKKERQPDTSTFDGVVINSVLRLG